MPRTLVVEDDPTISEVVAYQLGKSGHQVTVAGDGTSGLASARQGTFDLLILDLMLPGMSGIDLLRVLRRESAVPVIVLSARDGDADQVMALELGADDYVTKPFSVRQLLARISAVLRRAPSIAVAPLDDPADYELVIDARRHEVRKRGVLVPMPPKVFEVLVYLARNQNRACSRHEVLDEVWGDTYEGQTRTLDVHVHWLRQRIEDEPTKPRFIQTVRQYGYRFESHSDATEGRALFVRAEPVPVVAAARVSDLVTRSDRTAIRST